jgi:hypothetical protein
MNQKLDGPMPYSNGNGGYPPTERPALSAQNAFPLYYRNAPEAVTAESFIPPVNLNADKIPTAKDPFMAFATPQTSYQQEDLDAEMDMVFAQDEGFNPFAEAAVTARKIAEEFLQIIKTNFPNRYFILKRITQSPEFWEICLQKNYVIVNDDNYIKKLQNCFEVSIFLYTYLIKDKC